MKLRDRFNYVKYRVLVINVHADQGLKYNIIAWCLRNVSRRANIMFFCEVRSRKLLQSKLGDRWMIIPLYDKTRANNYVAVKQNRGGDRFQVVSWEDDDISFGSQYDRAMRGAVLHDRKLRRLLVLSSMHPDPMGLGLEGAPDSVRNRHVRQVQNHVGYHKRVADELPLDQPAIHLCGTDANESTDPQKYNSYSKADRMDSAPYQFLSLADMRLSSWSGKSKGPRKLLGLFVSRLRIVEVLSRRGIVTPVPMMDHEIDYTVLRVKKRKKNG